MNSNNENILERIEEDILDDILCEGDIVKVIRVKSADLNGYREVSNYYYEDDECDESYEEIRVSELIQEIRNN